MHESIIAAAITPASIAIAFRRRRETAKRNSPKKL